MSRSYRRLCISAIISGAALRAGLPGIGDLITTAWDSTRPAIQEVLASELRIIITLVSLAVFLAAMYFTWEIYIKGARKGRKGLLIVAAGMICGFVIASLAIGSLESVLSQSLIP